MNKRSTTASSIALGALLAIGSFLGSVANADEDISLFLNPSSNSAKPNVLFALDNSANWNATMYRVGSTAITKKDIIHQALYQAISSPKVTNSIRAGVMTFASHDGGKVISAVRTMDAAAQNALANKVLGATVWSPNNYYGAGVRLVPSSPNGHYYTVSVAGTSGATEPAWPTGRNATVTNGSTTFSNAGTLDSTVEKLVSYNNAPYALSFYEAYLYYRGSRPVYGTVDTDYDRAAINAEGNYRSPAQESACASNFVILIGNGSPDSGENNTAEAKLASLAGKLPTDPIRLTPNNYESNWADEFARLMAGYDFDRSRDGTQRVVTYVVDVVDPDTATTQPEKAARSFLKSIANQGQGRYFTAKNVQELTDVLTQILLEIKAVNSVFASVTLPVSVNVRGTNLNQVYMGVFRPNERPRWHGNLKLYQLTLNNNALALADKNGKLAESETTGFIVSDATSFWTTDSSYWTFRPDFSSSSDAPDGEVVEKGAAGQKLRAALPERRVLYTCTGSCGPGSNLSATPFDTSNGSISQAALGATSATERDAIINYIRGVDVWDEDGDTNTTEMRPSIHGDVLHSRPAVINYRADADESIVVYYGANDGVFHAVQGGKADSSGYELWGFVPPEFFGDLKKIYANDPPIRSPAGAMQKPYFVDGTIGVYQNDGNGDGSLDTVYLYLTMRRGGRLLYALDASTPSTPRLLWKRSNASAGYGELGQTWSEPKLAHINLNGTRKPVLIFGGGYDPAADDSGASTGTGTMGRAIFVVDAVTGDVIWQAGPSPSGAQYNKTVAEMRYSIPSDVTVIENRGTRDGYADRLYVGDTGGNIWRVDIHDPDPANWSVARFARLGNSAKFLYSADVVYADEKRADGSVAQFDAVLIGSGNREMPFDISVTNRFYMLKDRGDPTLYPIDATRLLDVTTTLTVDKVALAEKEGWYITLGTGEKVVTSAVTLANSTFFSTNTPAPASDSSTSCVVGLGRARNYIVNYKDGSPTQNLDRRSGTSVTDRFDEVVGGGFPPSPVPVIVKISDTVDGKTVEKIRDAVISGPHVLETGGVPIQRRFRVYWYKRNVDSN